MVLNGGQEELFLVLNKIPSLATVLGNRNNCIIQKERMDKKYSSYYPEKGV